MIPGQTTFELRRPVVRAYAALALAFAVTLLLLSLRRGPAEFLLWLAAFLGVGLVAVRRPARAPLVAGILAFLLGFVRTYRHGYNLDLGLALIALAVGVYWWDRSRREPQGTRLDIAGLALLSIAGWALVSMAFALHRIRAFAPAPGFDYHVYRFNPLGLSSEEAIVRVVLGAAGAFLWFGLYGFARSAELRRTSLARAVFLILLADAAVLLVQRHLSPAFLHPAGMPPSDRLNGITSFCYALGDVTVALVLLLPLWGSWRSALLTAASLTLLVHAAIASGSRSALLTMVVAGVAWAGIRWTRVPQHRRRLATVLSLAAAAALAVAAWAAYRWIPPDQATPLGRLKEGVERQGFFGHLHATRLSSYPLMLRVLEAYPLSGVGVGLYAAEVDRQRALLTPELAIRDPFLLTSNAPNQFLHTGAELGLPAMLALILAFAGAGWSAWHAGPGGRSGDALVGLATLALAFQFGPTLLNSEALVFIWLVVGSAARSGAPGAEGAAAAARPPVSLRATTLWLAAGLVLVVAGHLLARPSLAIDRQWRRLRWPLNIGMKPEEPGGRWTSPEATFVVASSSPRLVVRWHTGDPTALDYRGEVSFYVDGSLVERSRALPGRIRESVLPLPAVPGLKRISVRVSPPFVPAQTVGGNDRRELGVFVHSVASASPAEGAERP